MKSKFLMLIAIVVISANANAQETKVPSGYTYGTKQVAKSPFTLEDLKLLEQTLLFTDEDVKYLKMSHDILKGQTNDILEVWYGFVGGTPQLLYFFGNKTTGKPEGLWASTLSNATRAATRFGDVRASCCTSSS